MTDTYSGPLVSERYRTAQKRFWAGLVDCVAYLSLTLVDRFALSHTDSPDTFMYWIIGRQLIMCLYFVLPHFIWGQTIGKWVTGVKVLDVSETRTISLWQSLVRSIPILVYLLSQIVPSLMAVFAASYISFEGTIYGNILSLLCWGWVLADPIVLLVHPNRRALHDLVARTVVVRV